MTNMLKAFLILVLTMFLPMMYGVAVNADEVVVDNDTEWYAVSDGTVYWEKSECTGSGKHNVVCDENQYTDVSEGMFHVRLNGYSILDQNGNIEKSYFNESASKFNIPTINDNQVCMAHIEGAESGGHRLGWIKYDEVVFSNEKSGYVVSEIDKDDEEDWFKGPKDKTTDGIAETLKKNMKKDSDESKKSYVLADFSGSMVDFQNDVLRKIKSASGKKYVFAEDITEFVNGEDPIFYNIGAITDIANAFNKIDISDDSHIYLLSDLVDNCGSKIRKNKDFHGEITIVYYHGDQDFAKRFMNQLREAYPNASITGF